MLMIPFAEGALIILKLIISPSNVSVAAPNYSLRIFMPPFEARILYLNPVASIVIF